MACLSWNHKHPARGQTLLGFVVKVTRFTGAADLATWRISHGLKILFHLKLIETVYIV
jgi:hypothetical protein